MSAGLYITMRCACGEECETSQPIKAFSMGHSCHMALSAMPEMTLAGGWTINKAGEPVCATCPKEVAT